MSPNLPRFALVPLALLLLASCGEPVPEYALREGAHGLVLKVKHLEPITTPDGEPALYLAFEPHAPIDDPAAVRTEILGLWEHFRPEVQRQQLGIAILRASTLRTEGWELAGEEVQYVFRRRQDGSWSRVHDVVFAAHPGSIP